MREVIKVFCCAENVLNSLCDYLVQLTRFKVSDLFVRRKFGLDELTHKIQRLVGQLVLVIRELLGWDYLQKRVGGIQTQHRLRLS